MLPTEVIDQAAPREHDRQCSIRIRIEIETASARLAAAGTGCWESREVSAAAAEASRSTLAWVCEEQVEREAGCDALLLETQEQVLHAVEIAAGTAKGRRDDVAPDDARKVGDRAQQGYGRRSVCSPRRR